MPTVIYGTALVELEANGEGGTAPVEIPTSHGKLIVLLTTAENDRDAELPTGAALGDVVEIYVFPQSGTVYQGQIHPPSGETISGTGGGKDAGVKGSIFTKISSTNWVMIQSTS